MINVRTTTFSRRLLALFLSVLMIVSVCSVGISVNADSQTGDSVLASWDNNTDSNGSFPWWTGSQSGSASQSYSGGAAVFNLGAGGVMGFGSDAQAGSYDYVVFKIKGSAGNEPISVHFGAGGEAGSSDYVPLSRYGAITTEYTEIFVPLAENGWKNSTWQVTYIKADSQSTITVDEVYLTNRTPSVTPIDPSTEPSTEPTTAAPTTQPTTAAPAGNYVYIYNVYNAGAFPNYAYMYDDGQSGDTVETCGLRLGSESFASGNANAMWEIIDMGGGNVQIKNAATGRYISDLVFLYIGYTSISGLQGNWNAMGMSSTATNLVKATTSGDNFTLTNTGTYGGRLLLGQGAAAGQYSDIVLTVGDVTQPTNWGTREWGTRPAGSIQPTQPTLPAGDVSLPITIRDQRPDGKMFQTVGMAELVGINNAIFRGIVNATLGEDGTPDLTQTWAAVSNGSDSPIDVSTFTQTRNANNDGWNGNASNFTNFAQWGSINMTDADFYRWFHTLSSDPVLDAFRAAAAIAASDKATDTQKQWAANAAYTILALSQNDKAKPENHALWYEYRNNFTGGDEEMIAFTQTQMSLQADYTQRILAELAAACAADSTADFGAVYTNLVTNGTYYNANASAGINIASLNYFKSFTATYNGWISALSNTWDDYHYSLDPSTNANGQTGEQIAAMLNATIAQIENGTTTYYNLALNKEYNVQVPFTRTLIGTYDDDVSTGNPVYKYIYDSAVTPIGNRFGGTGGTGFYPLDDKTDALGFFDNDTGAYRGWEDSGYNGDRNGRNGYTENLHHNYHFTAEMSLEFTYLTDPQFAGKQNFKFSGDDDVWIFIDGERVLDIGGAHTRVEGTIDLGQLAQERGWSSTEDSNHSLKLFYAERRTTESNLRLEFTMKVQKNWLDEDFDIALTQDNDNYQLQHKLWIYAKCEPTDHLTLVRVKGRYDSVEALLAAYPALANEGSNNTSSIPSPGESTWNTQFNYQTYVAEHPGEGIWNALYAMDALNVNREAGFETNQKEFFGEMLGYVGGFSVFEDKNTGYDIDDKDNHYPGSDITSTDNGWYTVFARNESSEAIVKPTAIATYQAHHIDRKSPTVTAEVVESNLGPVIKVTALEEESGYKMLTYNKQYTGGAAQLPYSIDINYDSTYGTPTADADGVYTILESQLGRNVDERTGYITAYIKPDASTQQRTYSFSARDNVDLYNYTNVVVPANLEPHISIWRTLNVTQLNPTATGTQWGRNANISVTASFKMTLKALNATELGLSEEQITAIVSQKSTTIWNDADKVTTLISNPAGSNSNTRCVRLNGLYIYQLTDVNSGETYIRTLDIRDIDSYAATYDVIRGIEINGEKYIEILGHDDGSGVHLASYTSYPGAWSGANRMNNVYYSEFPDYVPLKDDGSLAINFEQLSYNTSNPYNHVQTFRITFPAVKQAVCINNEDHTGRVNPLRMGDIYGAAYDPNYDIRVNGTARIMFDPQPVTSFGTADSWSSVEVPIIDPNSFAGEAYIDDNSKHIEYYGKWSRQFYENAIGHYGTEYRIAKLDTFSATMQFTGNYVQVLGDKAKGYGLMEVYIDDALVSTVDCSSAETLISTSLFEKSFSTDGQHTIKLVKKSGGPIAFDAFVVRNSRSPVP